MDRTQQIGNIPGDTQRFATDFDVHRLKIRQARG